MRKVLIITYYWPPAGGPGVQRWLKFVKYLPEFGITPIVYVPENPDYPMLDENLLDQVPEHVTVLKGKIWEPSRVLKIFSKDKVQKMSSGIIPRFERQSITEQFYIWIRGNFFIPDARKFWVSPSVKFLKKYIKENDIRMIITSGPPHSLHLIGRKLQRKLGVKWITDFRDPWTTIGYHKSLKLTGFASNRHKDLESAILNDADHIIVTSKSTKEEFRSLTEKPIEIITNGYDIEKRSDIVPDNKFTLSHIGSLLSDRNPVVLWQAISELVRENPELKDFLEIKLAGTVSQDVIDSITLYGLSAYLNVVGYVPHDQAVKMQQSAQVLLLIEINSPETKSIIPGKLFEYMVSGRPVIGIGPAGSDFAEIIEETQVGIFADYSEKAKIKSTLTRYFELYRRGNLMSISEGTEKYSRKNITGKLAKVIDALWES